MTALESRRAKLCAQNPLFLTGIDFVQVVDKSTQLLLRVFLIVEPDQLVPPRVTAADLAANNGAPDIAVRIAALHGDAEIHIVRSDWQPVTLDSLSRICLEIHVAEPGGFEPYRLTIEDKRARFDPFFGSVVFDFKQGCETGFDCQDQDDCTPDPGVDFPVDYLARDFGSFRRALLDFAAQRYPDWREPIEADMGVMLLEIMAQLGDEFAYIQDRNDAEARFGSATQRASLASHASLVGYPIDRGRPARGEVSLTAVYATAPGAKDGGLVDKDSVLWAASDTQGPVPFTLDEELWVHPAWNSVAVHNPEPETECFARGLTELLIVMGPAKTDQTGPNATPLVDFLKNKRRAMLWSDPADPAWPMRGWPVTIIDATEFVDPLILTNNAPTKGIRIRWDEAEATPFDLPLNALSVDLNVVSVTAGTKVVEFARAGEDNDIDSVYGALSPTMRAKLRQMPRLIEREGPWQADARSVIARIGLSKTEATSLRFPIDRKAAPATIEEIVAVDPGPFTGTVQQLFEGFPVLPSDWGFTDDLLKGDAGQQCFTVEPGMWRTVKTYQLPFGDFAFADYAGDRGWSIKFGFGDFGEPPGHGTLLRITYHTDPGTAGNIAAKQLGLVHPESGAIDPGFHDRLGRAENRRPFFGARVEEDPASIRRNAPQYWRANPHRAVRPEDYSEIIERAPWVQKAHSVTRWTGSWSTDFVAVDPRASVAITPDQRVALATEIDCIRMVTRDARPVDPRYLDIDIEIILCVAAGSYAGHVVKRVRDAMAPPGFFDPDNFTFGQPLVRSAIEAAVQRVPGVAHVDEVKIRVHGRGDWRTFAEPELRVESDTIIRLQNDPDRSTLGLLKVTSVGGK